MICLNCGAKYNDKKQFCPYCHTENKAVAEKKKKDILYRYDAEANEMKRTLPQKTMKKWTKRVLIGALVLIALTIIFGIGTFIVSKISAAKAYNDKIKHTQILEEMFQNGEYEEIYQYMLDHRMSSLDYQKYDQVADNYDFLQDMKESLERIDEIKQSDFLTEEQKDTDLYNTVHLLVRLYQRVYQSCEKNVEDNGMLGNEAVLEALKEEAIQAMISLGIDEQSIPVFAQDENEEEAISTILSLIK